MYAFILASPRSGTTVLGEVLERHREIVHWYEPYFIWEYKLPVCNDDHRDTTDLTEEATQFIRAEFARVLQKSGKKVLVEKTPINAFKVDMIHAVFPDARFIHLVRDGRDVVHSIYREWRTRRDISSARSPWRVLTAIVRTLRRQRYWRNRIQAVSYEVRTRHRFGAFVAKRDDDWVNLVGWGPRFPGWEQARKNMTELEFGAMQWYECERYIQSSLKSVPTANVLEVRYEDLVADPKHTLTRIFRFLGVAENESGAVGFDLTPGRIGQFEKKMPREMQDKVHAIIDPMQLALGYLNDQTHSG
ncbi:MAG: sulfotransferase [Pseudomonadota bacterium]|nr:MAG: sulfotransferase [Pseudomonadota bacterium]